MSIETIFTIKKEHLRDLNPTDAEDLFRELLRAEVLRLGPENFKINVPRGTNVIDGGIDATVDANLLVTQSDIIALGKNGYQIKSGKTFKPWQKTEIRKELFGDRTPLNRETLGEHIQTCLDADGTYVLACAGIHLSNSNIEKARSHIEKYLKDQCDYENPKVKVWDQANLINFLEEFPLLVLGLRGILEARFKSHWRWSKDDSMRVPFVSGESQDDLIAKIRRELRQNDCAVYVPVWGDPGIGKTRLVLEATKIDDLSPFVIYYGSDSQFLQDSVMNELLQSDNYLSAIVVVDGCELHNQIRIWNELKNQSPRIKLITISNDYDKIPEDISDCEIECLDDEQISEIIHGYDVPEFQARRHTDLCSGSPKMAHHVGKTLAHFSGNASAVLSQDTVFKGFYVDLERENLNSPEVQERELVLQHIALFKQFGFKDPISQEAKVIAEKVKDAIPQNRFRKIVLGLKKHGVLKGDYTLRITPKALHIKLWTEWWETYSDGEFNFVEFTQDFTPTLLNWFYGMFKYAAESEEASRIVKKLLGPNGPFQIEGSFLINLDNDFFLALTEAAPESALECLKQTVEKCDRETLFRFTWRRKVVWALEKIAMQKNLFPDAARLLLALGEAENERWANNASGVFAGLFSLGPDRIAPTEESPIERLRILKEAFESDSKERRVLALKACDVALESECFSRAIGVEYQGLGKGPKLWNPETYGEWWEAYRQVWHFLSEKLEDLPEDEREEAVGILLQHARGIAKATNLNDLVVDTIRAFKEKPFVDNRLLIRTVVEFLHYEDKNLPDSVRQCWKHLKDELVGSDFHSMMQRYVGMDLLIDYFDENGNYFEQGHPQIHALAQQAVDTPNLLGLELHWLITTEVENGRAFGYELGMRDKDFCFLPMLLDAQRNAGSNVDVYFLGGYFRAIFERDSVLWETQLNMLIEDTKLNSLIPDLTRYSGLTDQAGLDLLNLAKSGVIEVNRFKIFTSGRVIESLSDRVFRTWIEFLLDSTDKSTVSIALGLYNHYYIRGESEAVLPPQLTFRMLTHPSLFEESDGDQFDTITDYYWTEIGKVFLRFDQEKSLELAELILVSFGMKGPIVGGFNPQAASVLTEATKLYSEQIWERVCKYLEAQVETRNDWSRKLSLERWLKEADLSTTRKGEGALTLIPREKIWEWIDNDMEGRAQHLAHSLVPKTLLTGEWRASLARATLVRYGERQEVRHALISNYLTGVSWGYQTELFEDNQVC